MNTIRRHILLALLCCLPALYATAQNPTAAGRSLTFTSETEVRFFIYLNGKLQNSSSTGRITLTDLEDKSYHIRIVMDDPFQISTTRTLRPDKNPTEYSVRFNPIQERIYITRSRGTVQQGGWYSEGSTTNSSYRTGRDAPKNTPKEKRLSKKEREEEAASKHSTGSDIKTIKTPYLDD